eukprot:2068334-Prymnesium_polylepis.1
MGVCCARCARCARGTGINHHRNGKTQNASMHAASSERGRERSAAARRLIGRRDRGVGCVAAVLCTRDGTGSRTRWRPAP